ncbi:MAG: hypothetical protein ABSH08_14895, partial [Tepidisphaeraceae bacterium]
MHFPKPLIARSLTTAAIAFSLCLFLPAVASANEAGLRMPDLNQARFFGNSIGGHTLLAWGIAICGLGFLFG